MKLNATIIALILLSFLVGCGTDPTKTTTSTTDGDGNKVVSEMQHSIPNIACKGKGNINFNINNHATAVAGASSTNQVNANMDCGDGFLYYHPTPVDVQKFLYDQR